MIHHVHVLRTVLACALLALVATVSPVCAAAGDGSSPDLVWADSGIQAAAAPKVISPAAAPASITDPTAPGETFQAAAMPAAITPAAPTVTTNGLLTFTSQAEFETAFPGLPVEDFEGGTTPAGGITFCTPPLDSTSTCAGLTIVDGLSISGPPTATLVVVGSGFGGWAPASTSLSTFAAADTHQIDFSGGNVNAVGFDLTGSGATTATVNVFGASGLLETLSVNLTTVTQTFTGIYSPEPITRITITAGLIRVIDNIQFGTIIPSPLTFYTSQAAFTSAHPGLPVEDFEESTVSDTSGGGFIGPLNSSTSNAFFSPGDIEPGLNIDNEPVSTLYASGGNQLDYPNTTKAVATNSTTSNFKISFPSSRTYAVGMDLSYYSYVPSTGDTTIVVYNGLGKFLGMTTWTLLNTAETFFGVYSNDVIGGVSILNNSNYEFIDNIRFGGSPAGLTFFDSQASFLTTKPGLPVEDFEESPVLTVAGCDEPIDSKSSDCFAPGDILSGIAFQTVEKVQTCVGGSNCPMAVLAPGFFGAPSYIIGANFFAENLEIAFTKKNVRYFGTDVLVLLGGPADVLFSVYDDHDNFLGSALRNIGTTPVFVGVTSSKHIARITLTNPGSSAEFVDNVRFGAFPWQNIIPAISGH